MCMFCGATLRTLAESANHPNICYGARRAYDAGMQSELTQAIKEMTKVLRRIDKQLKEERR